MKHRWPRAIHSQIESIFQNIRSIRETKEANQHGIRSFGAWKVYKYEAHRFASFMEKKGTSDLLDTLSVKDCMRQYLEIRLAYYVRMKRSRQTMETTLSALGKFDYALNTYIKKYVPETPLLDSEPLRREFYCRSKNMLRKSSKLFNGRAFPDPLGLIQAITCKTFQLQASLQYEGGLRAEGVGAPSNRRLENPLTIRNLRGFGTDHVTKQPVGIIASVEKGGKETDHYISLETYKRLLQHIETHGKLESNYQDYVEAINKAAKATSQYAVGRGSHALKHNFAQERYFECIKNGLTHEQALQQTSLETSHFRMRETLTYTRG